MRPKVVIGNWKMNTDVQSAQDLIEDFILEWSDAPIAGDRVLIVCPPFIALEPVGWRIKEAPKNMKLSLGAQHVHFEENGAYTGKFPPRCSIAPAANVRLSDTPNAGDISERRTKR